MRSVLVMIVFVTMHVLVLAQADDSSLITPAPSPSTFSIQEDTGDCDTLCELRCFFKRGIPPLYQACMQLCKLTCPISGGGGSSGGGSGSGGGSSSGSGGGGSGGDGSSGGSSGGGGSGGDGSGSSGGSSGGSGGDGGGGSGGDGSSGSSSGGGGSGGDGCSNGGSGGGGNGGDGNGGCSSSGDGSGQPAPTPPTPSLSSFVIHHCTFACVDSISTKLGSDAEKVKGDNYVKTCYNNCKKKY